MKESNEFEKFLRERGQSLEYLGFSDLALTMTDTMQAVRLARSAGIPIVGGEVYVRMGNTVEHGYAGWSVEHKDGETDSDYARRSYTEAEEYLKTLLPVTSEKEYLISLVTG